MAGLLDQVYLRSPYWLQRLFMNVEALRVERHRYGARFRSALEDMRTRDRWSRERIEAFQLKRLRTILGQAYEGSPWYREAMDHAGLRPSDVRTLADLRGLPILTKERVRAEGEALLTSPTAPPGALHGHTSGTTGSPLSLWYDRRACVVNNAADARQKLWAGKAPWDWIGLFLGRVVVPTGRARPPFWQVNYVQKQVWFSSFHMTPANLERYVGEVERRGLRYLEGYPSTLYILARHLVRSGRTLPVEAVFSSSETLHPVQRETIEETFESPLFDFYGQAERVIFAMECEEHEGKHLAEDYGITEVVDEHGEPVPDGEVGYLTGTSLHNTYMPMIRYRTSDLSAIVPEPCACGRTFRRIRSVTTKAEDIVVTPDGRWISPSVLTHPFKPFDQLVESQIIQEAPDRIRIKLVPSASFGEEHEERLLAGIRERVGEGINLEVEVVEAIPREPSGKFRWVISKVESDVQSSWT